MSKLKEWFGEEWYSLLEPAITSNEFKEIGNRITPGKFSSVTVYPDKEDIFRAFKLTPVSNVKVVILGQEPYGDGSATGLAFSNRSLITICPTLKNILKEVENDIYDGFILDQDPDLTRWAEQGVLLLNTALTVEKERPGSHLELWAKFTRFVLKQLAKERVGVVYILWGAHAKSYLPYINRETNFVLTASYPSTEEADKGGWFGQGHFSKTNQVLGEIAVALEPPQDPNDYKIKW